jgi:hypothetical protein
MANLGLLFWILLIWPWKCFHSRLGLMQRNLRWTNISSSELTINVPVRHQRWIESSSHTALAARVLELRMK